MATRYNITSTVQRVVSGNLTPGSSASALITDPSGNAITTYAAETGAGQVTNPITTNAMGRIEGWVETPDYNIQVSGTGITSYTEYIRQSPQGTVSVIGSTKVNWGTGFGVSDTTLYRSAADTLKTDDAFRAGLNIMARQAVAGQVAMGDIGSGVSGITFGTADDTNLYRSAAGLLKTDSQFHADDGVFAGTWTGKASFWATQASGNRFIGNWLLLADANPSFEIQGGGLQRWGAGGASAVDTTLYRQSAGVLRTDTAFQTGTSLAVGTSLTVGTTISIGADVNLFRDSANVLRTNDALTVDGSLTISGATLTVAGALDHNGSTIGFYGRTPTVVNATPFTNGAAVGTSQYDLPSGFTINQLAALLMTELKHLGDVNGVGLLNTTGV